MPSLCPPIHDSTAAAIDPSSAEWTPRNFRYNHWGFVN